VSQIARNASWRSVVIHSVIEPTLPASHLRG
jgi:hypothetical protein